MKTGHSAMDITPPPIIFENIKIEADSDPSFFGLSPEHSNGSSPTYPPFQEDNNLSTLLSSASPFSIAGSPGGSSVNTGENSSHGSEQDIFSTDFDLAEFSCDFDLLDTLPMDSSSSSPIHLDTPPLSPPSPLIKLEMETKPCPKSLSGNLPPSLAKILPSLKSSRGRSASHDSPDVQALKRHIRMIRNRESASLSRKKKKEYVTSLEERLREVETENAHLKRENAQLKARLEGYLPQFSDKVNPRTKLIAKVALLGVCCFVLLTTPGGGNYPSSSHVQSNHSKIIQDYSPDEFPIPNQVLHRHLQWHRDDTKDHTLEETHKIPFEETHIPLNATKEEEYSTKKGLVRLSPRIIARRRVQYINTTLEGIPDVTLGGGVQGTGNCTGGGFNKTESLRVQNHLKGLFSRGKPKKKVAVPKRFLYSLMDLNGGDNSKGLTVYDQRMQKYSNFLDNIQLREDTFYVVSLTMDDQLLLSAKASNASSRPKMSFLMPWRNDTHGGKEEVMQIDCEVTKVLNLKHFLKNAQPRK